MLSGRNGEGGRNCHDCRSGNRLHLYTVQDISQVDITGLGALSTALYQMAAAVCHHVSAMSGTCRSSRAITRVPERRQFKFFPKGICSLLIEVSLSSKMNGILKYRWDLHIHKVTLRNGLTSRNHFPTGLLFVTISYRKRI